VLRTRGRGSTGLPAPADLKVQLRAVLPPGVPRRGDRLPGRHMLAGPLEEALVVTIEAQIAAAVVDDGEQSQAREPIGVDDAAFGNRAHRRAAFGRNAQAVPFDAARAGIAEMRDDAAAYGPRELAAQPRKRILAVRPDSSAPRAPDRAAASRALPSGAAAARGFARGCAIRSADWRAPGLRCSRACSSATSCARRSFSSSCRCVSSAARLLIQTFDRAQLGVDAIDLPGVRAAKIAVVDEQAAGARRVLLD
jgi:hypothetical protein